MAKSQSPQARLYRAEKYAKQLGLIISESLVDGRYVVTDKQGNAYGNRQDPLDAIADACKAITKNRKEV